MRCRGKKKGLQGRAGLGFSSHLRLYFNFLNSRTGQQLVKTLFQTDDFFNFICRAKPDGSASLLFNNNYYYYFIDTFFYLFCKVTCIN